MKVFDCDSGGGGPGRSADTLPQLAASSTPSIFQIVNQRYVLNHVLIFPSVAIFRRDLRCPRSYLRFTFTSICCFRYDATSRGA